MLSCLKIDPKERPTIDQVLEHSYFTKTVDSSADDETLKEVCNDLIKRIGVFKLEGRQHLIDYVNTKLFAID